MDWIHHLIIPNPVGCFDQFGEVRDPLNYKQITMLFLEICREQVNKEYLQTVKTLGLWKAVHMRISLLSPLDEGMTLFLLASKDWWGTWNLDTIEWKQKDTKHGICHPFSHLFLGGYTIWEYMGLIYER